MGRWIITRSSAEAAGAAGGLALQAAKHLLLRAVIASAFEADALRF